MRRAQVFDRAAEIRVIQDVEEIASGLKAKPLREMKLASEGDVTLRGAEAAEGVASEIA